MKKQFYVILLCLIALSLLLAQNKETGHLQVRVTDQQGNPIENATVICTRNNASIREGKTDAQGIVNFRDLPEGLYDITCRIALYDAYSIKGVQVRLNQSDRIDIRMAKDSEKSTHRFARNFGPIETISPREIRGSIAYSIADDGGLSARMSHPPPQSALSPDYFIEHETDEFVPFRPNVILRADINPLSTFSIDVDTGSYSILRSWLQSNRLPPANSIRTEELLNYFSYDYPQPKDEHPFSIYTELGTCPWNEKRQLAHIGLHGKQLDLEDAPPSNLVFLVDVSGSMNRPNRLPLVVQSLNLLVDELREKDRISIVVYASQTGLVLPPTPGNEKEKIRKVLNSLEARGSTAGYAAIQEAYKTAEQSFIKDGNNRIILCTDGDFNVGVSSTAHLVEMVEEKSKSGIYITVLGFGMGNYKDHRLKQVAVAGNGTYGYIDHLLEARKIFVHELTSTLFTIAHDVKIQVEFNPAHVKAYRLIGYEQRLLEAEDFQDDTVDAGELGAGHTVTALYEIIPAGSDESIPAVDELKYQTATISEDAKKSNELLAVKLRYKLPGEETSIPLEKTLHKEVTPWKESSNNFRFSAAVAGFSMLLQDSEFVGDMTWDRVKETAKGSAGADEHGYRADFIRLVEMAEVMKKR